MILRLILKWIWPKGRIFPCGGDTFLNTFQKLVEEYKKTLLLRFFCEVIHVCGITTKELHFEVITYPMDVVVGRMFEKVNGGGNRSGIFVSKVFSTFLSQMSSINFLYWAETRK